MKALIVDTNALHKLLAEDKVGLEIWSLIKKKVVQLPCGGTKYKEEIIRSPLARLFLELTRNGSIRLYDDTEIDDLERSFQDHACVTSDDPHILAIAERSNCRVLFSADKALSTDFKNAKVLSQPRGKVLCSRFYRHIIEEATACKN